MTPSKSVRLGKKGQIVLPKAMRERLHVKEGDELLVALDGQRVVLSRPADYARATRGLLKGTWGGTRTAVRRYLVGQRRSWP